MLQSSVDGNIIDESVPRVNSHRHTMGDERAVHQKVISQMLAVWTTIVAAGFSSSFENIIQKRLNRNR